MEGVNTPVGCGSADGGGEGLGRNLATKGAGEGGGDDGAAENIAVELFNVENRRNFRLVGSRVIGGVSHGFPSHLRVGAYAWGCVGLRI